MAMAKQWPMIMLYQRDKLHFSAEGAYLMYRDGEREKQEDRSVDLLKK